MPAMTSSQREDVIIACRDTIKHAESYNELDVLMARVALASLTAEPAVWAHRLVNKNIAGSARWRYSENKIELAENDLFRNEVVSLYTKPPVQVLRPVELPDWIKNANATQYREGRDDVLEVLRQQGYEVKE